MKCCILSMVASLCLVPVIAAQSENNPTSVFAKQLKKDDTVLQTNAAIAKAHEMWKAKLKEAATTYQKGLESLLDKEKSKGDLEIVKSLERAVEMAKTQHSSPCILFDRLPSKAATLLENLNKAKSRENRVFVSVLDKEMAATLKQKGADDARKIEALLYASFLPETMESLCSRMARLENKIYLHIDQKRDWHRAYDWCRERNGDLASVGSIEIQSFLYKYLVRIRKADPTFIGGAKIGGIWCWTDGTPFNYTFWGKGQPSGKSGRGLPEDRLLMMYRDKGEWNDVTSDTQMPFLLQWTLY